MALNGGHAETISLCVTEDFVNEHVSPLGTSMRGRDAYRQRLTRFLAEFERLHYEIEDLLVDDDRAAVPYRMTCTWRDSDGHRYPVSLRGIFRFRVVDGLVAHRIDYWDSAEFERQVGPRNIADQTLTGR